MDDFERKLSELHDRVEMHYLMKNVQIIVNHFLTLSNTKTNQVKNFGMHVNYKLLWNIQNGAIFLK